eukprot:m.59692 g.59692  ORF g.59692 m.59692 type:complete len:578 (-) comp7232_c0_seq1:178-1911(-)
MDKLPEPLAALVRDLAQYAAPLRKTLRIDDFNAACTDFEAWQLVLLAAIGVLVLQWIYGFIFQETPIATRIKTAFFRVVTSIPMMRRKIERELNEGLVGIEKNLFKANLSDVIEELPAKGKTDAQVLALAEKYRACGGPEERLKEGKVSGTMYIGWNGYHEYTEMLTKVYGLFAWANQLHASIFPGVRQMEAEIIGMTVKLFHGGPDACGAVTSGGTESILMAVKAYREHAFQTKGITKPNLVMARTAHPAFLKACEYLKIAPRLVNEDPVTRKVDAPTIAKSIDRNTIAIVGSCVQYPWGVADDIPGLAALAKKKNIGLHVDSCLGSFLVPFVRECGYDFIDFDFVLDGVTTISVDTHKYGLAPKGSSVILFSNKELRHGMYSMYADWPGGVYGTPTMAGSRPGALVAATWAAMVKHGREGYLNNAKAILAATRRIAEGIKKIPGLKLVCEPEVSVVAWTSDVFDINRLCDPLMEECGWDLNVLQFPASMHIAVTMAHTVDGVVENFLRDLAKCVVPLNETPGVEVSGAGRLYGQSQAVPDRSIIRQVVSMYMDAVYQTGPSMLTDPADEDKKKNK